ncbi:MAG: zinc ribbon domain-containing protein [Acidobacteriota bacterium]
MPIYEFYCPDCHALFNFFSARIDTSTQPACPSCERPELARKPSRFAMLKHSGSEQEDDMAIDGLDESKLEGAMDTLMQEMGRFENDEDPRAMGHMMRRFSELSGLEMGDRMEELVARMERGEDPDSLEQEMGDDMDDDSFDDFFKLKKAVSARSRKPRVDDELYFL